jgi:hypothetical protein
MCNNSIDTIKTALIRNEKDTYHNSIRAYLVTRNKVDNQSCKLIRYIFLDSMPCVSDNNHLKLPLHLTNCERPITETETIKKIRTPLEQICLLINSGKKEQKKSLLFFWYNRGQNKISKDI